MNNEIKDHFLSMFRTTFSSMVVGFCFGMLATVVYNLVIKIIRDFL